MQIACVCSERGLIRAKSESLLEDSRLLNQRFSSFVLRRNETGVDNEILVPLRGSGFIKEIPVFLHNVEEINLI